MLLSFEVERALTSEEMDTVIELYRYLSPTRPVPTHKDVVAVLVAGNLMVARDAERVIGIAVLGVYRKLGGLVGVIEEFVIHKDYEGLGVAKEFLHALITFANSLNLLHLDLTSRPERTRAKRLYESAGFVQRATHSYRRTP